MTKNHAEAWVRRTFSEFKEVYLELLKTKSITKEDLENLLAVEHKIPPIYFLPKIHKSHNSESGSFVGRPIISACSSVWKPADLLITQITRFLLHDVPGSLINTTALLNRIEELDDPTENTILFSADVVALNPSIPTNEGIIACWSYYINNFTKISDYCERNNWLPPPNPETFRKTHPPGGGGASSNCPDAGLRRALTPTEVAGSKLRAAATICIEILAMESLSTHIKRLLGNHKPLPFYPPSPPRADATTEGSTSWGA